MSLSKAQIDPRLKQPVRDITRPAPDRNLVLLTKFLPGSKIPYFYYTPKDSVGGNPQSLSIEGSTLTISEGNSITLPAAIGGVTTPQLADSMSVAVQTINGRGGEIEISSANSVFIKKTYSFTDENIDITDSINSSNFFLVEQVDVTISDTVTTQSEMLVPAPEGLTGKKISITANFENESTYLKVITPSRYGKIANKGFLSKEYFIEKGERIEIESNGEFWLLTSSVNEKQLSFLSIEEAKKERYDIGELVNVSGQEYKIQAHTYLTDTSNFFLVSAKSLQETNLLFNSELFTRRNADGGVSNTWSYENNFLEITQNTTETKDPLGTNRATKVREVQAGGNLGQQSIRAFGKGGIEDGDTITISFYAKQGQGNVSIRGRFQGLGLPSNGFLPEILNQSDLSNDWKKFEQQVVAGADRPTNTDFNLYFENQSTDDFVYIAFLSVSISKGNTKYIQTGHNVNDTPILFAVPLNRSFLQDFSPRESSNNGEAVLLSEKSILFSSFEDQSENDAHQWQLATESCASNPNCQDVVIDVPLVNIDTLWANDSVALILPRDVKIRGELRTKQRQGNPEIRFSLGDSTAIGIWADGLTTNQNISNITFTSPNSRLGCFLDRGNTLFFHTENCTFSGSDSVKVGVKTGRYNAQDRALFSYFTNSTVTGCDTNMVYQNCGNEHFIDNAVVVKSVHVGIKVKDSGHLAVERIDCEDHDELDLLIENSGGREISFEHSYFEGTEITVNNAGALIFRDNRFSGKGFNFNGSIGFVEFTACDLNEIIPILPKETSGQFNYNILSRTRFLDLLLNAHYNNNKVVLNNNYYKSDNGFSFKRQGGKYGRVDQIGSVIEDSYLQGVIGDTMTLNNVYLKGLNQNLRPLSDSLGFENGNVISIRDTIIGGVEYDMMVVDSTANTGSSGLFSFPSNFERTIPSGNSFVFTFEYMHLSSSNENMSWSISSLLNSTRERTDNIILSPSLNEFNRVTLVFDSIVSDVNRLIIEGANVHEGDVIVFRDFQVNEGKKRLSFVPTGVEGVDNNDLIFKYDGAFIFDNSVQINGDLIHSDTINIFIDAERSTVLTGNTTGYWNVPDNLIGARIIECQFAYKTAPTGGTSDLQLSNGSIGFFGQTMADGDRVHTTNNGGTPYTLQSEEIIQPLQASTTATTPGVGLIVNLTIVKD